MSMDWPKVTVTVDITEADIAMAKAAADRGYRTEGETDVDTLNEIWALRRLGFFGMRGYIGGQTGGIFGFRCTDDESLPEDIRGDETLTWFYYEEDQPSYTDKTDWPDPEKGIPMSYPMVFRVGFDEGR